MTFRRYLESIGSCPSGIAFARGKTFQQCYDQCDNPLWLAWFLIYGTRVEAIYCTELRSMIYYLNYRNTASLRTLDAMTFDYRWSNRVVGECISKSVTLAKITVRRSTRIIASAMTTDKRIVLCEFLYELIGNNLAVEYRFSMLNQLKNAAESRGQESVNYETIITCSDNARRASQTVGNHIADEMKRRITLPSPHWEDL